MIKQILFYLTVLFIAQLGNAQISSLNWVKQQGGPSTDDIKSIAVDQLGNVFTGGNFSGTSNFDPSSTNFYLTSKGSWEGFVSKLDMNGNFLWAFSIGSTLADYVYDVATDNNGNLYVSGAFQGTVDFDPNISNVTSLTAVASQDAFVAKYSPTGDLIWVKQIGGSSQQDAFSLIVDVTGDVYVTGTFYGTVDFDPGIGTYSLTAQNAFDAFVLKLTSAGDFVWAKQLKGDSEISALDIQLASDGSVFVVGEFFDEVDFDPSASVFSMTSSVGLRDAFILKLDNSGNFIWAKQIGGTGSVSGISISINTNNEFYLAGGFKGIADFDPNAGINNLTSLGIDDAYLAKFDTDGNLLFVIQMGGLNRSDSRSVFATTNGQVYVAGYFEGILDLTVGGGPNTVTSNGGNDIFIAHYLEDGSFVDVNSFGSIGSEVGFDIAVSNNGLVHLGGYFEETVDFNPGSVTTTLSAFGSHDGFVIQLGDCNTYRTDTQVTCESFEWIDGVTYTSSGNTATWTLPNAVGCDSIITLDLTILQPINYSETITACGSAEINGITYTSSQPVVNTYAGQASNGCDSIVTTNLIIKDLPDVTTTLNGLTITANLSEASYQWVDCTNGNAPINGENNATFTATTNGSYAVIVTKNGCTDISACSVVSSVGLKDFNNITGASLFPNPTENEVTVRIENMQEGQYIIKLLDATGRLLSTQKMSDGLLTLNLTDYEKGIYIIHISNGSNQSVHRIIKK